MERNTKSFISILIIFLLSVCTLLPFFSVTTSATPSYTDIDDYYPNGSVDISLHVTNIYDGIELPSFPSQPFLHFSPTTYSGSSYTWSEFTTHPSWDSPTDIDDPLLLHCNSESDDYIDYGSYYDICAQFLSCDLTIPFDNLIRMDVTLRDFYVFDGYFDDVPEYLTQSIDFYLSTSLSNTRIFSSRAIGSADYRYRKVGDALYTDALSSSYHFNPTVPSLFDSDGRINTDVTYDDGTHELRLNEFSNLANFEEGSLYHFDFLTLTYYIDPTNLDNNPDAQGGSFSFDLDIFYTDVHNIDNIVITADKSNIHIPPRDLGSWLGKATTGFFSAEFIPGFSFGGLVVVVLSFALLIWFLKLFAGG